MAGADSTSILLRSIFYYMMKNPATLNKATIEVDEAFATGKLSWPPKYQEVVASCSYVCAVIKEASRIFPSFAVQIQRYSPPEGIKLSGHVIPPGYRVGMNPHIVHMDKEVFGQDAGIFKPERWLESEERCRIMDRAFIGFGVGTRPCAGRNVSQTHNDWSPRVLLTEKICSLHSLRSTSLSQQCCGTSQWKWPMTVHGRYIMPALLFRPTLSVYSSEEIER